MCLDFLINVAVSKDQFLYKIELHTSHFLFIFIENSTEMATVLL